MSLATTVVAMTGLDSLLLSDPELWLLLAILSGVGLMLMQPLSHGAGPERQGIRITVIAALAMAGMASFAWWGIPADDHAPVVADAGAAQDASLAQR